jgi:hypothetical protein
VHYLTLKKHSHHDPQTVIYFDPSRRTNCRLYLFYYPTHPTLPGGCLPLFVLFVCLII